MTKINDERLKKQASKKYNVHSMQAISTTLTTDSTDPKGCDFTASGLYSGCQPYELATLLGPRGLLALISVNPRLTLQLEESGKLKIKFNGFIKNPVLTFQPIALKVPRAPVNMPL
jgi:hypothetical protein